MIGSLYKVRRPLAEGITHDVSLVPLRVAGGYSGALVAVMTLGPRSVVAQATPIAASGPQFTPLLAAVLAPPRWFRGADEEIHLVYELVLTNATTVPVDLTELAVLDADDDTVVTTLSGASLGAATSQLSSPNEPTTSLPAGKVGVVWLDVRLPDEDALPARIAHQLTVHVPPGLPLPETIVETGGPAEVDRRPPLVLGPPSPAPAGSR